MMQDCSITMVMYSMQDCSVTMVICYPDDVLFFRSIALAVILIRAGLGLDPAALRKLSFVVFRLAFAPCLMETLAIAVASHFLLNMPWVWAFILG